MMAGAITKLFEESPNRVLIGVGAWVSDKYLLAPVITRSYSGITLYKQF